MSRNVAHLLQRIGLVAIVAGLFGLLLAAGLYNVAASRGHYPGVGPLLHWTMNNSVTLRARLPEVEVQSDEAALQLGAVHYADVCEYCHAAPGAEVGPVGRSMEPPSPKIVDVVDDWQRDELFWIVQHGIIMTGMPAWPAPQRAEEIAPVVAFLEAAGSMPPEYYERLTRQPEISFDIESLQIAGDGWLPDAVSECARCHGGNGEGVAVDHVPRIGGQPAEYLSLALVAYARSERASGIMQPQAARYDEAQLLKLAEYYAAQDSGLAPRSRTESGAGPAADSLGARIVSAGIAERDIPPCSACHGPARHEVLPLYPQLAGQRRGYIETQLELFRSGARGGSPFAHIMESIARKLSPSDIRAVADYYASFAAEDGR